MNHSVAVMFVGVGIGVVIGGVAGMAVARARSEKPPRTRTELLEKARELNVQSLRAPVA